MPRRCSTYMWAIAASAGPRRLSCRPARPSQGPGRCHRRGCHERDASGCRLSQLGDVLFDAAPLGPAVCRSRIGGVRSGRDSGSQPYGPPAIVRVYEFTAMPRNVDWEVWVVGRELFGEREGNIHCRLLGLAGEEHPAIAGLDRFHTAAGDLRRPRHEAVSEPTQPSERIEAYT